MLEFHFVCDPMTLPDGRALAALQRPSWPPLPGHHLAMQRIAARVSELYHDPESWTELDLRLKDVEWSMNDIGHWPLDVWCVFASAQDLCLVGNVNTASRVDDAGRIYGHRVTMLHPHEMKTRGAPSDRLGTALRAAVCASRTTSVGRSGGSH